MLNKINSISIEQLSQFNQIVIYGAGPIGELLLPYLEERGIKPVVFCDIKESKRVEKYFGYEVVSIETLARDYRNAAILITPMRYFYDAVDSLIKLKFNYIFEVRDIIKDININDYQWKINNSDYLEYCRRTYNDEVSDNHEGLVLRYVDMPLTQKCNLNCRDCADLMQYIESPIHYELSDIINYIDTLEECVDEVTNLVVLGGELMLYKPLPIVLSRLSEVKKFKQIMLFTNGTILPSTETIAAMKKCNLVVQISNYGKLSKKLDELVEVLKKEGISYSLPIMNAWMDMGDLSCRNRSDDQCQKIFNDCNTRFTWSYLGGGLGRCPRSNYRWLLGYSPDEEIVNLMDKGTTIEEKRNQLMELKNRKKFVKSCNYCDGVTDYTKTVPVAVQVKRNFNSKILEE